MAGYNRKSTPKVKDGQVCKKNNWKQTPTYWNTPQDIPVLDKERPGKGYRHLLRRNDLVSFISILPDWEELSKGLDAVLLAPGGGDAGGWYDRGIVAICAWERELWREADPSWYEEHKGLLKRLNVPCAEVSGWVECRFTEATARAYQLAHIFLHELGHHHDRITTKYQLDCARGEGYAEKYALQYEKVIWDRYEEVFGLV